MLFIIAGAFTAPVVSANVVKQAHTEVELVPEVETIQPGHSYWVALRMTMDEHWHVYWKNPGDSGLATTIEWNLPPGFKASPIFWPYPKRLDIPPLTSYGYEHEVYLLTSIKAPADLPENEEIRVEADVEWLACKIQCIPGKTTLFFDWSVDKDQIPVSDGTVISAKKHLPVHHSGWNLKFFDQEDFFLAQLSPKEDPAKKIDALEFFPERDDLIDHAAEQHLTKENGRYELKIKKSPLLAGTPSQIKGVFVTEQGWDASGKTKAWAVTAPVLSPPVAVDSQAPARTVSLVTAIVFALLGGLILNLMPCVLPVLSIKVLSLVEQSKTHKRHVAREGLMFALGILVMFWLLAGLMLVLQAAGKSVGWGFQFQSPVFVILMAMLFFWLSLNLFGVFEIGTSLSRVSGRLTQSAFFKNSFFNGMLTTVVATPCTAPFMGAALGFSLTQPPSVVLLIFTSLGVGLATPYLILCLVPSLTRWIPKPGPWMVTFKRILALPLLATGVWLSTVLGAQHGSMAMYAVWLSFIPVGLGSWVWGRWMIPAQSRKIKNIAFVVSVILFGVGLVMAFSGVNRGWERSVPRADEGIAWQPYSEELVDRLVAQERIVFIDFTASWCLTCRVNEEITLNNRKVIDRFKALNVAAVKADWTSYDPKVTKALAKYGKNSIPQYILYIPGEAEPRILPEILVPGIVLKHLPLDEH